VRLTVRFAILTLPKERKRNINRCRADVDPEAERSLDMPDDQMSDPGTARRRDVHPVDELHRVRLQIRRLREREARLRRDLLDCHDFVGREWEAIPTPTVSWRIDRHKLPREIAEDPSCVRRVTATLLRLVPVGCR
jgi:hypothetical protein